VSPAEMTPSALYQRAVDATLARRWGAVGSRQAVFDFVPSCSVGDSLRNEGNERVAVGVPGGVQLRSDRARSTSTPAFR